MQHHLQQNLPLKPVVPEVLSNVTDKFWLLRYGLGLLLCFIGVKMICAEFFGWHIPTLASLAVIIGILVVSVMLSVLIKKPATQTE